MACVWLHAAGEERQHMQLVDQHVWKEPAILLQLMSHPAVGRAYVLADHLLPANVGRNSAYL